MQTAGTIHFFFEGYFVYNHRRMGSRKDLFGQLWKEYALSDSRYMYSDPFVLCMETWTAVRTLKSLPRPLLTPTDHMGPIIILDSGTHHERFAVSAPNSSPGVDWSILWGLAVLYDQSVRRLLFWEEILSTRAILFLVLLCIHERVLDHNSFV